MAGGQTHDDWQAEVGGDTPGSVRRGAPARAAGTETTGPVENAATSPTTDDAGTGATTAAARRKRTKE